VEGMGRVSSPQRTMGLGSVVSFYNGIRGGSRPKKDLELSDLEMWSLVLAFK